MRHVINPQLQFGEQDISAIELDFRSRDDILRILAGLQHIYITAQLREEVFTIRFQIARAFDWLKDNFDKPLRIEELASKVGLSTSAFHSHFRSTTAMSPLQFQSRT